MKKVSFAIMLAVEAVGCVWKVYFDKFLKVKKRWSLQRA